MGLSKKEIYEKIANKELSVEEGMQLLQKATNSETESPGEKVLSQSVTGADSETNTAYLAAVQNDIKTLISDICKIDYQKIQIERGFFDMGLESSHLMEIVKKLESKLQVELYPTLLFEYTNIKDLTDYLIKEFENKYPLQPGKVEIKNTQPPPIKVNNIESVKTTSQEKAEKPGNLLENKAEDIAIIGLAGKYPMAEDVDEFWENLKAGKDCITEVPEERWDWKEFYDPDPVKAKDGKIYCKEGGFITDVDKFDPLFFNISPREAELMDPQERWFLQIAWKTIEDAGYTLSSLGRNVGVFAGVTTNTYLLFGPYEWMKGNPVIPKTFPWSIANRVSYCLNFIGPSIPVDTACSSSLTAIHYACESLKQNECKVAIAGGVNFYLHYSKFLMLCQNKMLSPEGRSHAFGIQADGFGPGEGVGAILLKPLSDAITDNDHIYAVIKATSINHGGKASGYSVPNPVQQSALIIDALERCHINPDTINYIEAHGTGTDLGDPVEIQGLTRAFSNYTKDKQFCALGSAKSNIGHLEAGAGIAGITKILLQLKYKQLAPSIHTDTLNPKINFSGTPFYVQQRLDSWKQREIKRNGVKESYPRRTGISAFGAGGANAHIILEEYSAMEVENAEISTRPLLFIFSAKTEHALKEYVTNFRTWIVKNQNTLNLPDVAYTLQAGREAFDERVAVIARDINEITDKLNQYGQQVTGIQGLFAGNIKQKSGLTVNIENSENNIKLLIRNGDWEKIALLWINGNHIPWQELYPQQKPKRISLPTYVFSRERLWIRSIDNGASPGSIINKSSIQQPDQLLFYTPIWKVREQTASLKKQKSVKNIIVFDTGLNIAPLLRQETHNDELSLTVVRQAEEWQTSDNNYSINPDNFTDYLKVFEELKNKKIHPDTILYFWNIEDRQTPDISDISSNNRLIFQIFFILKAIHISNSASVKTFHCCFLSGKNITHLYNQAAMAFTKSIAITMPEMDFSAFMLEKELSGNIGFLREFIINQLKDSTGNNEYSITLNNQYRRTLENITGFKEDKSLLNKSGVYLITGGLGGIGLNIARHLLIHWDAAVILTGRSAFNAEKQKLIASINNNSRLVYKQADVCNYEELRQAIQEVKKQFGKINGIIHAAGVVDNVLIIDKELKEFAGILKPKIEGTLHLDKITQEDDLDFFMLFSSVASVIGDMGQCDYAIANRFMDNFCAYRESLRKNGTRKGKTIAIGWPLWREGGMHINPAGEELYLNSSGQKYLEAVDGIKVFETALKSGYSNFVVFNGDKQIVDRFLGLNIIDNADLQPLPVKQTIQTGEPIKFVPAIKDDEIKEFLQTELKELISSILLVDIKNISDDENFSNFGFDSISLKDYADRISSIFHIKLLPTHLFSYSNIDALQSYLLSAYLNEIKIHYSALKQTQEIPAPGGTEGINETPVINDLKHIVSNLLLIEESRMDEEENISNLGFDSLSLKELADKINSLYAIKIFPTTFFTYTTLRELSAYLIRAFNKNLLQYYSKQDIEKINTVPDVQTYNRNKVVTDAYYNQPVTAHPDTNNDVAIIGIAGIFPGVDDIDTFWKHLAAQDNLITEIPIERWDWKEYFGNPHIDKNKTNSKWGAFINDVDKFDAAFFKIAPSEAIVMDPQHRLFLECTWTAIEDAGYNPYALKGKNIGVFVGAQFNDYYNMLAKTDIHNTKIATGTSHSLIPNRISFLFNFHGPSLAIDTACSSSLVAFHQAVKSIQSGESESAITGGVALLLEPDTLIKASQLGIISSDGRCKTFDKDANGYVKGEGIHAFFLKPLDKAIIDRDHIYAIVKGTAVNHGGIAQSLTAPNAEAQSEVIFKAYKAAGIDPRTISYIETHGTGTELGDPIEVNGLKIAFEKSARYLGNTINKYNYCGLGSIKTNIGHLEPAAGTAGLIKALLAMRYKKLPGLVNFNTLNPYIELKDSPFYIIDKTIDWKRLTDQNGKEIPLRAGVSSFGFGGVNAHVLIEEYISDTYPNSIISGNEYLIILSAKTPDSLKKYALNLKSWLEQNKQQYQLSDIEYNLITGRAEFEERVAFVVNDEAGLISKLNDYYQGQVADKGIYSGNALQKRRKSDKIFEGAEGKEFISQLINNKKFNKIAELWVSGFSIDWVQLISGYKGNKLSIPTYPFEKKRYWYTDILSGFSRQQSLPGKTGTGESGNTGKLFYFDSYWKEQQLSSMRSASLTGKKLLIFVNDQAQMELIIKLLGSNNADVYYVIPGKSYKQQDNQLFINLHKGTDYSEILKTLQEKNKLPEIILYCWGLSDNKVFDNEEKSDKHFTDPIWVKLFYSVHSLFFLLHAFNSLKIKFPSHILFNYKENYTEKSNNTIYASLSGLAKSLALIAPTTTLKIIRFKEENVDWQDIKREIYDNDKDAEIYYADKKRSVKTIKEIYPKVETSSLIKDNGVYIITGGAGALGLLFANHLFSKHNNCTLILCGRSESPAPEKKDFIEELMKKGCKLEYIQADVSYPNQIESLITSVLKKHHQINGIIHAAGTATAETLFKKDIKKFSGELRAKIIGTYVLDEKTKDEQLDFFMLFGSIAAFLGDYGQGDYAIGNKFLNDFCAYRESLRQNKKRSGKTIVINWPLWKEGGMHLDSENEDMYLKTSGTEYLEKQDGLPVFDLSLSSNINSITLFKGNYSRILRFLGLSSATPGIKKTVAVNPAKTGPVQNAGHGSFNLKEAVTDKIKEIASRLLYTEAGKLQANLNFGDFGFDSITLKDLSEQINSFYQITLTPAVFFAQSTIEKLGQYLINEFPEKINAIYKNRITVPPVVTQMVTDINTDNTGNIQQQLLNELRKIASRLLYIQPEEIKISRNFGDIGFDSITLKDLSENLNQHFSLALTPAVFFAQSTIEKLSTYLLQEYGTEITRLFTGTQKPDETIHEIAEKKDQGEQLHNDLISITAHILSIPDYDIDPDLDWNDLGFDPVLLNRYTEVLINQYQIELSQSALYTNNSIRALENYLLAEYAEQILKYYNQFTGTPSNNVQYNEQPGLPGDSLSAAHTIPVQQVKKDIAIIGMSGRFPGSQSLDEFWQHLENQDCLVTEVPKSRWNWEEYYGDPQAEDNKTYSKWGAFINDVDKFDPLFFRISPNEAEMMDPQHRLFLECSWEAIEDAGYKAADFSDRKIGVYAGVQFSDYMDIIKDAGIMNTRVATGNSHAVLANRISYIFNLHGPSEAIDTACSSSLVAFHRAVKSIQTGENEMAITGGVSLMLTPYTLIGASKMGIISPVGLCKTFDKAADGYVKGEGIQVFLLKPLDKAVQDKDHIYAVVKATAENHGGQAHSLTAPNSDAQGDLVYTALKESGIDPLTLTYIECHGTGTELGDPVEVNGLKTAFRKLYNEMGIKPEKVNYCGLGSIKTNIGHLEPAAGTAGLVKLLLSLMHKKLPGLATFKEQNPYVQLDGSPFYLVTKTKDWEALSDKNGNPVPRRAGVSSFGFGGANAHVIVEEYNNTISDNCHLQSNIFVLSAKNSNVLKQYAVNILNYLDKHPVISFNSLCYTLQTGREIMEERCAFVCSSIDDLKNKLKLFSQGQNPSCYYGTTGNNNCSIPKTDLDAVNHEINNCPDEKIAQAWVCGIAVEWQKLYKNSTLKKISLPGYPFRKKSYWIPEKKETAKLNNTARLHPPILSNVSDLKEQNSNNNFTGKTPININEKIEELINKVTSKQLSPLEAAGIMEALHE